MNEKQKVESNESGMDWDVSGIWNLSLAQDTDREYLKRDYLWASELGKIDTDVYLRMKGTEPTNPPNPRSLRKFEAGNIWEWVVELIFRRAGILQASQERVKFKYPDLLEVSGKIDFVAGGQVSIDSVKETLSDLYLPERTNSAISDIVAYLQQEYPQGLRTKAIEIKSVSSFVMNACEVTKRPMETHAMQAYHYTKHPDITRTDLVYICRDDCRMMTFPILENTTVLEELYYNHIKRYTENYKKDVLPEKAEPIVFNESEGRFSINRQIGWSPYLTMVYGFEDQMQFEEKYKSIPASWNRVLKRIKTGQLRQEWLDANSMTEEDVQKEKVEGTRKYRQFVQDVDKVYLPDEIITGHEMTAKNKEAIAEMEKHGYDAIECARKLVLASEEDEVDNTG